MDDVDVNILCAPGYSEAAVINKAIQICESRGDCIFIVDAPFGLEPQDVADWHNGASTYKEDHVAFNSSYAAAYWPWLKVYDEYNDRKVWVPPSGLIAGVYAYNDSQAETWFAPAGLNRGRLTGPLAVEYAAGQGDRDMLYSNGNAINPIINIAKEGITVWGQRTLQRKASATDRVNVRRLMNLIRKSITLATRYYVFESNDSQTWTQWKDMVNPYLMDIKNRRGLYNLLVVMDATTVTDEDIDNNRMPGIIYVQPTKSAEIIPISFVVTKTGVHLG